jgi:type I restriction-modification system DNA methylase subunit
MVSKQYYTPLVLARFLIEQIDIESPKEVVDICAGSWNLFLRS